MRCRIEPDGRVHRVDILQYRESYGGEIRSPSWLAQFVGKSSASPLKVGSDIRNISGATLVVAARDGRRQENLGGLWTPPIAFAARGRCSELSSRSHASGARRPACNKRSTRRLTPVAQVHRLMSFHDPAERREPPQSRGFRAARRVHPLDLSGPGNRARNASPFRRRVRHHDCAAAAKMRPIAPCATALPIRAGKRPMRRRDRIAARTALRSLSPIRRQD